VYHYPTTTEVGAMKDRLEIYRDLRGGYRWRLVAPNGRIIADSSESYTRRWSAWRAARRFLHTDAA
jgi:uncharacterized protein YegP (UPF0339 family)